MYTVQTMNNISDIIYEHLPKASYLFCDDVAEPDAILVRSASLHDMQVPDTLLAVARAGAGVNNIPIDAFTQKGIAVFNTPGANANAVAELVLLGMLMSGRKVIDGIEWAKGIKGQPDVPKLVEKGKGQFVGPELRGKTLGVIGLGAIGALVANAAARGLGMRVLGMDPFISVQSAWTLSSHIERANSLEELLEKSDFVSINIPLTDKTRGVIDAKRLGQMKRGAHLLNFSRAELVNGDDVRAACASGQLATYVTDFPTDDMLGVKGVICIPHLGASTPESEENCAMMAARELRDYLELGAIHNSVNLPEMDMSEPDGVRMQVIHENTPGLVNRISGVFADKGININGMVNKSRGEVAVTTVDMKEKPDAALLEEIAGIASVTRVRLVGA